jgi:cobalamin biosynthesis Mg chelatase CobN
MKANAESGKTFSYWLLTITDKAGKVSSQSFTGSAFSQEAYNALIKAYQAGSQICIEAKFTDNPTNPGSGTVSSKKEETVTTDQAVEAEEAQTTDKAADQASAAASGDKTGTASKNSTKSATKNQKVTGEDSDAETVDDAAEEEQVAEVEESVIEDVAQAEDNDVTANEADGGAIAETAANSSHAWMWLIVVLACACAAAILFVVFKRRKEEA